jgi:hypothetical protein
MSKPTDFYDDVSQRELYAIDHLYGVPQFAKEAQLEDKERLDRLPLSVFGDPKNRKFSCHTKAATWLANAYFKKAQVSYSKYDAAFIQDRLMKAATFWNIRGLVDQFNAGFEKLARFDTPDLRDDDYALVVHYGKEKVRRMPINTALCVKHAGEYLYANRFNYPFEWRKAAASRILQKAVFFDEQHEQGLLKGAENPGPIANFEQDTAYFLQRAAELGMNAPELVSQKVAERAMCIPAQHGVYREMLLKIAEAFKTKERCTRADLHKMACALDIADRETGLCTAYPDGLEMPEEICFNVLQKEAADILDNNVMLQTGNSFPLGAFGILPIEKVASVLGAEIADSLRGLDNELDLTKLAEIAPTLPRCDAKLLERLLEEAVNPGA